MPTSRFTTGCGKKRRWNGGGWYGRANSGRCAAARNKDISIHRLAFARPLQPINPLTLAMTRQTLNDKYGHFLSPSIYFSSPTARTTGASPMPYQNIQVPAGNKITTSGGKLKVPDQPIVPFI